jgi:hypothetical protein
MTTQERAVEFFATRQAQALRIAGRWYWRRDVEQSETIAREFLSAVGADTYPLCSICREYHADDDRHPCE